MSTLRNAHVAVSNLGVQGHSSRAKAQEVAQRRLQGQALDGEG